MKIRTKILLCFMLCALLVAAVSYALTSRQIYSELQADRESEYRLIIHQTLNGMDMAAEDIESTLISLHTGIGFAGTVQQQGAARSRDIVSKLRYMCYNSSFFTEMALIDADGEIYHGARDLTTSSALMRRAIDMHREELTKQYTQWFADEEGNIFLKKDIYAVTPLYHCGMLIARLDGEHVRSLLGLDIMAGRTGNSVIMSPQGTPFLINGDLSYAQAADVYARCVSGGENFSGIIELGGREYYLQSDALAHSWQMMHLISVQDMQSLPARVSRMNLIVFLMIFALSVPILFIASHSLTKGINRLYRAMDEVSRGNFDVALRTRNNDEIGRLTRHFSWLLGELKTLTAQMISRATEKQQAEYEMLEVKYRSLQSQVSPHFICNILTTINAMAEMDKTEEVSELSILAGRYLRSNLRNVDEKMVSFGRELHNVQTYLEIYRSVYGDRVHLDTEIPQEALPLAVPNMLLQPLVENALMHGGLEESERCDLSVTAAIDGGELHICLTDNGRGIEPALLAELNAAVLDHQFDKKLKGFGLRGVIQRLRLIYGSAHRFEIASSPSGTRIFITLPLDAPDGRPQSDRDGSPAAAAPLPGSAAYNARSGSRTDSPEAEKPDSAPRP